MQKRTFAIIVMYYFLSPCASTVHPSSISEKEVKDISKKYFLNKYNMAGTGIVV